MMDVKLIFQKASRFQGSKVRKGFLEVSRFLSFTVLVWISGWVFLLIFWFGFQVPGSLTFFEHYCKILSHIFLDYLIYKQKIKTFTNFKSKIWSNFGDVRKGDVFRDFQGRVKVIPITVLDHILMYFLRWGGAERGHGEHISTLVWNIFVWRDGARDGLGQCGSGTGTMARRRERKIF